MGEAMDAVRQTLEYVYSVIKSFDSGNACNLQKWNSEIALTSIFFIRNKFIFHQIHHNCTGRKCSCFFRMSFRSYVKILFNI